MTTAKKTNTALKDLADREIKADPVGSLTKDDPINKEIEVRISADGGKNYDDSLDKDVDLGQVVGKVQNVMKNVQTVCGKALGPGDTMKITVGDLEKNPAFKNKIKHAVDTGVLKPILD